MYRRLKLLKFAHITYKKDEATDQGSYRPAGVLPLFSKNFWICYLCST